MLGGVVFSTLRTFLADNAGIGLPLGIERVIRIGSKTHASAETFRQVILNTGSAWFEDSFNAVVFWVVASTIAEGAGLT